MMVVTKDAPWPGALLQLPEHGYGRKYSRLQFPVVPELLSVGISRNVAERDVSVLLSAGVLQPFLSSWGFSVSSLLICISLAGTCCSLLNAAKVGRITLP